MTPGRRQDWRGWIGGWLRAGLSFSRRWLGLPWAGLAAGVLGLVILAGCGPGESEPAARTRLASEILDQQATEVALHTRVAANIYASQTAAVPTATPTPRATLTPTSTPTFTPTQSPTPTLTPAPGGRVTAREVMAYEGPGTQYRSLAALPKGTGLLFEGQHERCAWLKIRLADGQPAWISGHAARVQMDVPCEALPAGAFRPMTGTLILDHRPRQGRGELTIENGTSKDAVLLLANLAEAPQVAIYVQSGERFTLTGIPDGEYVVFFAAGEGWLGDAGRFELPGGQQRFTDTVRYTSSSREYTTWTLTLHPVVGGTAETEALSPDEFPPLTP